MTDRLPLRVGLLLDHPEIPWWIAPAIQEMQSRGLAAVVLAVQRAPEPDKPAVPRPVRWWRHRKYLGHALMDRIDRRRSGKHPSEVPVPLATLCPGAESLVVAPISTRFSDTIRPEDSDRIAGHDLDLILRLGFRILRGPVLSAARQGVWSFHHGDNRSNRGGPAGVWEVLFDRADSGLTLQRLTEDLDGGVVLAWQVTATQPLSPVRNERHLLRHSSRLLLRSIERLAGKEDPSQLLPGEAVAWRGYAGRLYRTPSNRELVARLARLGLGYLKRRIGNAGRKLQWSIAWHWRDAPHEEHPHGVLYQYHEIPTPRDRYWADPFVVRHLGRWWMFFEEFQYRTGRGELLVWEMGSKGPIGTPAVVLSRPYHLSYPQVFEYQGRWYMLPETGASRQLEYYVADEFPHRWSPHAVAMEGIRLVDATLLEHEGRWYLFASPGPEGMDATAELQAFMADSPFGPFTPHPMNPLVLDIRRARMGGRFFRKGGSLFRPAQRCIPRYGAGLVMHEIAELSPARYRERIIQELDPDWQAGLLGMHTLNAAAGLSVLDFQRLVRR